MPLTQKNQLTEGKAVVFDDTVMPSTKNCISGKIVYGKEK